MQRRTFMNLDGRYLVFSDIPNFGGVKKNRLFMAASQSLYAVYVGTEGAQVP